MGFYFGISISRKNGELAQLARAPALHVGGHRFDSGILHIGLFFIRLEFTGIDFDFKGVLSNTFWNWDSGSEGTFIDILRQSVYILFIRYIYSGKHEFNREGTRVPKNTRRGDKLSKGVWGMPRLPEAKKDVISCEKPWGSAHTI